MTGGQLRTAAPHGRALALAAPAAIGLAVFFVAPLVTFLVYSVLTAGLFSASLPFTGEHYVEVFTTRLNGVLAQNAVIVGVLTATVCLIVAMPVAYWLRYASARWRLVVLFVLTTSMLASYLVRVYSWRTILGETGILNRGLEAVGLIDEPLGFLLFSRFAVIVALVHIFIPYMALMLYIAMRPLEPAFLETAQDLGATTVQKWSRVILPLIAAPATSAWLLVLILSASDYVTPQLLGGTDGVMLGVRIKDNLTSVGNWPLGAATAFAMLAGFVACYALAALALRWSRLDKVRWVL